MKQKKDSEPVKTNLSTRQVVSTGIIVVVAFLIGFVPIWWKSRDCFGNLARIESQYRLAKLQNDLASAVIDAQRGAYEPARQAVSRFFTSLRVETEKGHTSILTPAQIEKVSPLFSRRDEIITLLARDDYNSGGRLTELYLSYRKGVAINDPALMK